MKFTEAQLEDSIIKLLGQQGYPHVVGSEIERDPEAVLIKADLRAFLATQYADDNITNNEIEQIIRELEAFSAQDLYASNKAIMKLVADGFTLKREDYKATDLHIYLVDFPLLPPHPSPLPEGEGTGCAIDNNIYKLVNQLEIQGNENLRIPDGILYINGLPLVVFEFKSPIRENADCFEAYTQITTRYRRDIPELFKYNALCVLSDGVNTKSGSFFADYGFYYAWRKVTGNEAVEKQGIDSLHTMVEGLFNKDRVRDVIRNFIYMPDTGNEEIKILCRYPQYYAATKLFANIKEHAKFPDDNLGDASLRDGKGGTYFGATGCGKSYTMLFLSRLLMKSVHFSSPTIVLITDRTDLDDQLSETFSKAKTYIGDNTILSVKSRSHLRELLQGRESGGVFLTTIHKFSEDIELLTDRSNVICISDEAHRSQTNLDQKVTVDLDSGKVTKTFGFAKYLHDSLPNATYVGFTGTPVDATLDVFGEVVDAYTMTESVQDKITVPIVYEGRAAKVFLDNRKLQEIENYYEDCVREGASEYHVEESKKASASMQAILGDPDRLKALAHDFVNHYEKRVAEASTVKGKAMFVCSSRQIAYDFYKQLLVLRPEWGEVKTAEVNSDLSDKKQQEILPNERVKMIMTRGKDDVEELYELLGSKEYRKSLDTQFKKAESNFKIAIVVDMWLTGFDVPFLDTIYIDKPLKKHNLIQTISRVNRNFSDKKNGIQKVKGLVVDYIGIKDEMNQALAMYSKSDQSNIEDIEQSIIVVRDHLDLLKRLFHGFDTSGYFSDDSLARLACLKNAAEFVQQTPKLEKRFMDMVKRLKAAYDICSGNDAFNDSERDHIHFYLAVRSIVYKLTKGDAPDTAQMNRRVQDMVQAALQSDGVEEVFKLGEDAATQVDIFNDDYLERIASITLPNTKIKLLQQLLAKAIGDLKKVNKVKGVDFSKKFQSLVERYNSRETVDDLPSFYDEATSDLFDLLGGLQGALNEGDELGISLEEMAFYDILKRLAHKYNFEYADNKLIELSKAVKVLVDDKAKYTDWNQRDDIKSELKMDLIMLLAEHGYPPVDSNEVYQEVFEQAENFKGNR
jgi:type I restriction enzyme R subunit